MLRVSYLDELGYQPSISEENSWKRSVYAVAAQLRTKLNNNGIILEMQVPLNVATTQLHATAIDRAKRQEAVSLS